MKVLMAVMKTWMLMGRVRRDIGGLVQDCGNRKVLLLELTVILC